MLQQGGVKSEQEAKPPPSHPPPAQNDTVHSYNMAGMHNFFEAKGRKLEACRA